MLDEQFEELEGGLVICVECSEVEWRLLELWMQLICDVLTRRHQDVLGQLH